MLSSDKFPEDKLQAPNDQVDKHSSGDSNSLDQMLLDALERDRQSVGDVSNVCPTGGLIFKDQESIDLQRRIVWDFLKTMGRTVVSGTSVNMISISLPVRIFEPRSFLARLSDTWSCAPYLLNRAAQQTDPVRRFKYVIAFAIAGLHVNVRQWKPFNPILGETLQFEFPDETKVFLEQTSHHPPVSHFEIMGPDRSYKVYGYAHYSASWRGNAIKGYQTGPNIVEFPDGTKISYNLPYLWLSGILYGERVSEYLGQIDVVDKTNMISCHLRFNPDGVGYLKSWFVSSSSPSDTFRGDIIQDGVKVDQIEGSWIGEIRCRDGEVLYDVRSKKDCLAKPAKSPLPSDSRFRSDLDALLRCDLELAQTRKTELEELQRSDRALRNKGYIHRQQAEQVSQADSPSSSSLSDN